VDLFFAIALLAVILYTLFIGYTSWRWKKIPDTRLPASPPQTLVSVVVPVRNEMLHIEACVTSILAQEYPADLFEVIVVDDHSEDSTLLRLENFIDKRLKVISLQDAAGGKKKALATGINRAKGELIVTTDGDCVAPPTWLASIVAVYESKQAAIIASPVVFDRGHSSIEHFQSLDFAGTMILTGVGIRHSWFFLGNGANLAFPKAVFETLNGYQGIDHLASGDDLLLIHKAAQRFPARIHFNKSRDATVITQPQKSLRGLFWQRIRWAGKSGAYSDRFLQSLLLLVFFVNAFVLLAPLLLALSGSQLWITYTIIAALKILADLWLLETGMRYFHQTYLRPYFPIAQLYHILYVAGIGPLSLLLKQYPWKGRKVR